MTRQDAVWHANHVFNIVIERCLNAQNLKDAREFDEAKQIVIEALQQEPKWIPVTERLPKRDELVLVTYKTSYKIDLCKYLDDGSENPWWSYMEGCVWNDDVIAWQPLPEPYEESDGE